VALIGGRDLAALTVILVLLFHGYTTGQDTGNSPNSQSPEKQVIQSMEEAKGLVIDRILSGDVSGKAIYQVKIPISKGTIVKGWKTDVETVVMPFEKGWFFFVDDYRTANWEHPCRYVFVDYEAKEYKVFQATTPPRVFEKSVSMDGEPLERRLRVDEIEESIRWRLKEEKRGEEREELGMLLERVAEYSPSGHVVLISGGYDADNNRPRYLKNLRHYYVTLTKYGYTDDQIDVLYADGSAADLDCDGDNDVDGNARKTTVQSTFNALPFSLDHLHVFVTDHGGTGSGSDGAQFGDSHIWLWNQEWITDMEVAALVSGRNPECASYVLAQCFSGGFIDDLLTTADKVVIATACRGDEYSWSCDTEGDFDEFVYHHINALRWAKPSGDNTPEQICEDGAAVDADSSGDGIVSLREAHEYVLAHDSQDESPQFAETPAGQGDKAWLGGCEGAGVAFTFTCSETLIIGEIWDTVKFDPLLTNTGAHADSYLVTLTEDPPTPEEWWVRLSCWGVCWDTMTTVVRIYTDDPLQPTQTEQMYLDVIPRTAGNGSFTIIVESLSMPDTKLSRSVTFLLDPYLCGDANADGVVDLADIVCLINFLYRGGDTPIPMEAGDANCDGIINVADIVYLVNYLYRDGDPPGCP